MNETTNRMVNIILDEITTKSENGTYNDLLVSAIKEYIDEKSLVEKWKNSGFDDNLLDCWLNAYLAPIADLNYTEACNWFINRHIHRQVEEAMAAFDNLNTRDKNLTADQVEKMYFDLRNLIAPLVPRPEYDLYVEQVTKRAQGSVNRYLNSLRE